MRFEISFFEFVIDCLIVWNCFNIKTLIPLGTAYKEVQLCNRPGENYKVWYLVISHLDNWVCFEIGKCQHFFIWGAFLFIFSTHFWAINLIVWGTFKNENPGSEEHWTLFPDMQFSYVLWFYDLSKLRLKSCSRSCISLVAVTCDLTWER